MSTSEPRGTLEVLPPVPTTPQAPNMVPMTPSHAKNEDCAICLNSLGDTKEIGMVIPRPVTVMRFNENVVSHQRFNSPTYLHSWPSPSNSQPPQTLNPKQKANT